MNSERFPRRLAAILYADVAGYSRLTGEDEDATHRILGEYLTALSNTIESHGGRVMHYAGDAVLARFDAVIDALTSAVTIQNELIGRNRDLPKSRRVQFRIGINLGDVIEDRGEIYGDGVNVAARLQSLAEIGGICISESVRVALGRKSPVGFECMGEQRVKNIAEPVLAYRALISGGEIGSHDEQPRGVSETDRPSIVVLPFTNAGGGQEQEYLADGITEEIINGLGRFRELLVIARGSSFKLKQQRVDAQEAATRLGVRYVLEGNLRRGKGRVRISVRLTDAQTGRHMWGEHYDRVLEDLLEIQDDVAQRIVAMLAGRLEVEGRERAMIKSAHQLTAYDYLLRGRYYFKDWKGARQDVLKAREMFEKSIELAPMYAAAYSALAATYLKELEDGWSATPERPVSAPSSFPVRPSISIPGKAMPT